MMALALGWPQLTYLLLSAAGLGLILAKHGQRRDDSYNIWSSTLATAFMFWLLYSGGFFTA